VGLLLVLAVLGGGYAALYARYANAVPDNTSVLGVDIGGLSRAEAEQRLEQQLPEVVGAPVTLVADDTQAALDPAEAGLSVDVEATVRSAGGASASPLSLVRAAVSGGGPIAPVTAVDTEALTAAVQEVADTELDREAADGTITFRRGEPVVRAPVTGLAVDVDGAADAVAEQWLRTAGPVEVPTEVTEPAVGEEQLQTALNEVAEPAMAAPIVLASDVGRVRLTPVQLGRALTLEPDDNGTLQRVLDDEVLRAQVGPRLDRLGTQGRNASVRIVNDAPQIVPSRPGVAVDTEGLDASVLAVLTEPPGDRVVQLDTTVRRPTFTTADARASGVREVVAEFTTFYPHADYRNINIGRGAQLVNNTFLEPGEVFSLNGIVGERTVENGFTTGFIIDGGRLQEGLGGGVSQLATTLFNAGHFAGYEDVEHRPHSFFIDRYPPGREATVAWGSLDMAFRNNTPYGAVVQAFINPSSPGGSGSVTARIWSTPYWDVTSVTGEPFNFTQPERRELSGPTCFPSSGTQGFDIVVTRTLRRPGTEPRTEELYTRYDPEPIVVCE
jgi:vancomycin resistance protein YoaR